VNYADRKATDSFATPPSVGKSIWLLLDPVTHELGEVVQNFEGEADPARMKLDMQTWNWIKTSYSNDTTVTPKKEKAFTATFAKDGKVSFTTDCNRMSGGYTVTGNKLVFGPIAMTKMYCEGSQENEFAKMISEVGSFLFTSKGELILELKLDSGQMVFR
jgi:heat shock protein HslJ